MMQIKIFLLIFVLLGVCGFAADRPPSEVDSKPHLCRAHRFSREFMRKLKECRIRNVEFCKIWNNDDAECALAVSNNGIKHIESSLEITLKVMSCKDVCEELYSLRAILKKERALELLLRLKNLELRLENGRLQLEQLLLLQLLPQPVPQEPPANAAAVPVSQLVDQIDEHKARKEEVQNALQKAVEVLNCDNSLKSSSSLSMSSSFPSVALRHAGSATGPFAKFKIKNQYFLFFPDLRGNPNTIENAELECCIDKYGHKIPISVNYSDNTLVEAVGVVVIPNEKFVPKSERQPQNVLEVYLCSRDLPTEVIEIILVKLHGENTRQEIATLIKFDLGCPNEANLIARVLGHDLS